MPLLKASYIFSIFAYWCAHKQCRSRSNVQVCGHHRQALHTTGVMSERLR
jgi:hypothetical protein